MDRKTVEEYISAVKKQTKILSGISVLLAEKGRSVASGDTAGMEAVEKKISAAAGKIKPVEEEKSGMLAKLAEAAGLPPKTGIDAVLLKLDKKSAEKVGKAMISLLEAVKAAKGGNMQNKYLLMNRLNIIRFTGAAVKKMKEKGGGIYGSDGNNKGQSGASGAKIDRTI